MATQTRANSHELDLYRILCKRLNRKFSLNPDLINTLNIKNTAKSLIREKGYVLSPDLLVKIEDKSAAVILGCELSEIYRIYSKFKTKAAMRAQVGSFVENSSLTDYMDFLREIVASKAHMLLFENIKNNLMNYMKINCDRNETQIELREYMILWLENKIEDDSFTHSLALKMYKAKLKIDLVLKKILKQRIEGLDTAHKLYVQALCLEDLLLNKLTLKYLKDFNSYTKKISKKNKLFMDNINHHKYANDIMFEEQNTKHLESLIKNIQHKIDLER